MKTLSALLLALPLILSAAVADAQTAVRPDFMGGYRYSDSAGNWGSVRPDFMGGYRTFDLNTGHTINQQPPPPVAPVLTPEPTPEERAAANRAAFQDFRRRSEKLINSGQRPGTTQERRERRQAAGAVQLFNRYDRAQPVQPRENREPEPYLQQQEAAAKHAAILPGYRFTLEEVEEADRRVREEFPLYYAATGPRQTSFAPEDSDWDRAPGLLSPEGWARQKYETDPEFQALDPQRFDEIVLDD